ncbi:MAG: hypothetical protein ACFB2W_01775 [Leptolyngbyaceae cyanobacterium]
MVSLKRTLKSDLASSIEVLNPINQVISTSNLHTPLRYSAVLLSIGKTTHICHQNIPLKKIRRRETVTYVSAIPRKLAKVWAQPTGEIASRLVAFLQTHIDCPVWSRVYPHGEGWIEFVISQYGIEHWRQQLVQTPLPVSNSQPAPPIESDRLWKLQSGYELCCRWQMLYRQTSSSHRPQVESRMGASTAFQVSSPGLQSLVHCLVDMCDRWQQATPTQLLQQADQLVVAIEQCTAATRLKSAAAGDLSHWLTPAQIILEQLLQRIWGGEPTEQF